ncbi:MAG: CoA pyrophosphatase [Gemmatimonadaceae bacterium]|jgi:8-oxo-dGTP pyrophosphatase MutT (NUDIX family)|nr:CoA pyrophosphatase [Gemmatimonadaceae bacterium]
MSAVAPTAELDRLAAALAVRPPVLADAEPTVRRAATALILRHGAGGLELLLIQRAVFEGDPWSGQVALPGGRADAADASLVHTAMRETREETGLDLAAGGRLLGQLDELHPRTPVLPPIVVRPHVFALERDQPILTSREVAEAFWVPLAVLRDPATTQESRIRVRDAWWRVPSFVVQERVVWGMTERMLRQLLGL